MLTLKGKPMFEGDFEPLFKLEHMLKDVRHCLAEAEALGVDLSLGRDAERPVRAGDRRGPRRGGLRRRGHGDRLSGRTPDLKRERKFP